MTTFLWNTAQAKDVAKISLVTQSAGNLGYCLNSLLKAGADIASKDDGSDIIQEKVNICHLVLYCIVLYCILIIIIVWITESRKKRRRP